MTVHNEADNIGQLLDTLLGGSVAPDEIIVADGSSTDATVDVVGVRVSQDARVRLLQDVGDRAAGRNSAVAAARFRRIVTIDGGCQPRPDWLEHMVEAFDQGADWVGGFYEPVGNGSLSTAIGLTMVYVREEAERHFVPSARSLGFTRELWAEVGGFPEGLQFAEDTLFAEELFRRGHRPLFAPDAIVDWHPPRTLAEQARTMFNWGHGDGLQGLRSRHYIKVLAAVVGMLLLIVIATYVDARLLFITPIALVPFLVGNTRDKYRHMNGWSKWALIPVAAINGTISSLMGFLVGRAHRKRAKT